MRSNVFLAGAELGAVAVLENGDDFSCVMIDLALSQRAFAALERDSNEERIFSRRNVFAAEKIDGLNGRDFRDVERANRIGNCGKSDSIGEQQREIALDAGKTRQRLIAP